MLYDTFSVGENWQQPAVTEANPARMYWAAWAQWDEGNRGAAAGIYGVKPDWLRATGLNDLFNWDAWVWLPRYLVCEGGLCFRPPTRELKKNVPETCVAGALPFASRRAFLKAFPAPAKRRKAVVS